jgi:electron transport complex protein RnfG
VKAGEGIWRSALSLALVALLGTALLSGVNRLTAGRIAEQERRAVLRTLGQVVDPARYDNALQDDVISFRDELHFPRGQTVTAYRARSEGRPEALILKFAAVNGYNGRIQLLVGINPDGSLSGVRVTSHQETPGLGDFIEIEKSGWVTAFTGKSLRNPEPDGWAVRRDGGEFDQFTGATITPRAVVDAVAAALLYYQANAAALFETPSQGPIETDS